MGLRTDPVSGTSYGAVYESEDLEVYYFVDRLGPQVQVVSRWGYKHTSHPVGVAIICPRQDWDAMLEAAREAAS